MWMVGRSILLPGVYSMDQPTLRVLIRAYRLGNEDVFEKIYQRSIGIIYNIKKHYPAIEWEDEDCKQESQIVLHHVLNSADLTKGETDEEFERLFFGYFQRSLFNHFLNQLRKEKTEKRKSNTEAILMSDMQEQQHISEKDEDYIVMWMDIHQACVDVLDEESYALLTYRLQGYTMRECAKKLHRGTKYTQNLLYQLRDVFGGADIFSFHPDDK